MGAPRATEASTGAHLDEAARPLLRRLLGGIAGATLTLLLLLALLSHALGERPPWAGPVGEALATVLFSAFGLGAWALLLEALLLARRLATGRGEPLGALGPLVGLAGLLCIGAAAHLARPGELLVGGHRVGGASGELLGELLRSAFGGPGGLLLAASLASAALLVRAPGLAWGGARLLAAAVRRLARGLRGAGAAFAEAWRKAAELDEVADGMEPGEEIEAPGEPERAAGADGGLTPRLGASQRTGVPAVAATGAPPCEHEEDEVEDDDAFEPEPEPEPAAQAAREAPSPPVGGRAKGAEGAAPRIVAPRQQALRQLAAEPAPRAVEGGFELPGPELLEQPPEQHIEVDAEALQQEAERLAEALRAYKIQGTVDEIRPGPVVTMFEYTPKRGTKLNKISGLGGDLAMALAAESVRIVAPIPGKGRVGFEVPNRQRQTVWLRELLEDRRWQRFDGALPIVLGRDITGQPVYADLSRMPHLLVAGTTGSGKSVGINVMLLSLLCRRSPEELRLLLVDPKMVELAPFEGIPHMLLPVVTDMSQAARALRWAVDEMERRYQLFAHAGTKNVESYNRLVERYREGSVALERFHRGRKKGTEPSAEQAEPQRLPHLVVVVDEFADLMAVASKEVEQAVARLAQKARAAGIHVILATQRPSVDVITGYIKSNFPARVAFRVMQGVDSKTILGRVGAEQLLGKGDMLFLPPGSSDLVRVHGAFVGEEEVHRVCEFLRAQGEPQYDERILAEPEEGEDAGGGGGDDKDADLYHRALEIVRREGYCSTSFLQRKLGIGYNRAARLVDRMEEAGVVGPPAKAGGKREVLM